MSGKSLADIPLQRNLPRVEFVDIAGLVKV